MPADVQGLGQRMDGGGDAFTQDPGDASYCQGDVVVHETASLKAMRGRGGGLRVPVAVTHRALWFPGWIHARS
ncbi:hypothetical protein GCM10023166_23950 [Paeniglutamicibacter cryotolerans]